MHMKGFCRESRLALYTYCSYVEHMLDGREEFLRHMWKSGVMNFNKVILDTMKVHTICHKTHNGWSLCTVGLAVQISSIIGLLILYS